MFALCNPNMTGLLQGEYPKFGPKVTHPLLIWASETFDRKLRPNGYRQRNGYNETTIALSNGVIADPLRPPIPPKMGVSYAPNIREWPYLCNWVIRSTSCLVLGYGFRGRRIERRYLRFEQIQDGRHRHVGEISSGDISATARPIHFMFGYRVGFSGTADLMALF